MRGETQSEYGRSVPRNLRPPGAQFREYRECVTRDYKTRTEVITSLATIFFITSSPLIGTRLEPDRHAADRAGVGDPLHAAHDLHLLVVERIRIECSARRIDRQVGGRNIAIQEVCYDLRKPTSACDSRGS